MQCRGAGGLQNDIDARTQLAAVGVLVDDIKPATEVNSQRFEDFPFVLEINPIVEAGFTAVIGDRARNIGRLGAGGSGGENQVVGVNDGFLNVYQKSASHRM